MVEMTIFGPIMGLLNYLRPTKSPFILVMIAILFSLTTKESPDANAVPVYTFYGVTYLLFYIMTILSFWYVPVELKNLPQMSEDDKQEVFSDIENQFKFVRSLCLAVSVIMYFILLSEYNNPIYSIPFVLISVLFVLTIMLFTIYVFIRNIKEESFEKYSIFQIGVLTSICIIGACLTERQVDFRDSSYVFNCRYAGSPKESLSESQKQELVNNGYAQISEEDGISEIQVPTILYIDRCDIKEVRKELEGILEAPIALVSKTFDFKALSSVIFTSCWLIYFVFWLLRLKNLKFTLVISERRF